MSGHFPLPGEKLTGPERQALADAAKDPVAGMVDYLASVLDRALRELGTAIQRSVQPIIDWLVAHVLGPIMDAVKSAFAWVGNLIGTGIKSVLDSIATIAGPCFPLDVTRPLGAIGSVAAVFIAVTATIGALNALHPFKNLVLDSTQALIFAFMGYEMLVSAFWRPVMSSGIEASMRYSMQKQFRPYLLDHREADDCYFEGTITEAEWRDIHAMHGWRDEWIQAHFIAMDAEPNLMALTRIADTAALDEEWTASMLRQQNFRQPEIDKLMEYLRRRPVQDEIKMARQQAIASYVQDVLSFTELGQVLRGLGHKETEIDILLQAALFMRQRKLESDADTERKATERDAETELRSIVTARRAVFVQAFARDLISDSELVEDLLGLGLPVDLVGAILDLEQLKKIPKPKRERLIV